VKSFRLDRKKAVTYGMVVEAAVPVTLLKVWIRREEEVVVEEAKGSPRS
jgi:hypothetical protein